MYLLSQKTIERESYHGSIAWWSIGLDNRWWRRQLLSSSILVQNKASILFIIDKKTQVFCEWLV